MRLFHLSDLHIGLKLLNWDMREDQEYIWADRSAGGGEKTGCYRDRRRYL